MNGGTPHLIPSIYLANYLNDFEIWCAEKKNEKRGLSYFIWSN